MPVTQLPLNEIILAAVLAFCRIGACLMLMPGISSARIPLQVRLFICRAAACSSAHRDGSGCGTALDAVSPDGG
ncbi:flagellar biosynthesis protein FliR [Brucella melitensis]